MLARPVVLLTLRVFYIWTIIDMINDCKGITKPFFLDTIEDLITK